MSEHADYLTDAMLEGKAAHEAGHCEYGCQWCDDEGDDEDTGPPPDLCPHGIPYVGGEICLECEGVEQS